jgi:hypothetical protein
MQTFVQQVTKQSVNFNITGIENKKIQAVIAFDP